MDAGVPMASHVAGIAVGLFTQPQQVNTLYMCVYMFMCMWAWHTHARMHAHKHMHACMHTNALTLLLACMQDATFVSAIRPPYTRPYTILTDITGMEVCVCIVC